MTTLSQLLQAIRSLVYYFVHPGDQYYSSLVGRASTFIVNHKLILFFVLVSFLFLSIRLIKRLKT